MNEPNINRGIYINLKAEMSRHSIQQKDIAEFLGVSNSVVCNKLRGKSRLTVRDLKAIRDEFFPDCTIDYLAATND